MADFVLVHGSWLGAWCWDETASLLRDRGHRVVSEDLPGHGRDATPAASCTLGAYVERVGSAVESLSGPAVLVGHSMAGVVISGVAERSPRRIAELVYVSAYLLGDGESIGSISGHKTDSLVPPNLVPAADGATVSIREAGSREAFFADCSEEAFRRAATLIRPEPTAAFDTPLRVSGPRFGSVPRTYIRTARDRALRPALQDRMLAATPCRRVMTIETGHCPFLAAPDRLAALLGEVVR